MPDAKDDPHGRAAAWAEVTVHGWNELLTELHAPALVPVQHEEGRHRRSSFLFRGMADASWRLLTSLERLKTRAAQVEGPALRALGKYAPAGAFSRGSEWERLAVAQHNGLPTRVLDWTASPLIAAHFATADERYSDADGAVWCVDAVTVRTKLLPRALVEQLDAAQAWLYDVRLLDSAFPRLSDFDETDARDGDVMIFLEPPSLDARIHNQVAIQSLMNGPTKSHHEFLDSRSRAHPGLVRRVVIDRRAKAEIRDMLDQNNINERMLFPGLPGLCAWLRRYYGPV
jgi:hypothetical protein